MSKLIFSSGQRIRSSGLYYVLHDAHRLPQRVALVKEQTFPPCAECDAPVSFIQVRHMPHLDRLQGCIVLTAPPVVKDPAA